VRLLPSSAVKFNFELPKASRKNAGLGPPFFQIGLYPVSTGLVYSTSSNNLSICSGEVKCLRGSLRSLLQYDILLPRKIKGDFEAELAFLIFFPLINPDTAECLNLESADFLVFD
jgi:hypothetical protein